MSYRSVAAMQNQNKEDLHEVEVSRMALKFGVAILISVRFRAKISIAFCTSDLSCAG
jgi:hypothetical protein